MNKTLRPWLRHGSALGCAAFLLVGRWSPQRLGESFEALSFLPELRTIALFGLCVILAIIARQSPIRKPLTAFPKLIAAFLAWACLSYFWSINQEAATLKIADLLLLSGFMICFYQFSLRFSERTFISLFAKYYIALLAILCLCAAFSLDYAGLGGAGLKNRAVFAVGSGPNVFGRNMALLTIACLLALNHTKRTLVPILLAGIPLSFVLLTGSRGALLELLVGLALTVLFMRRHFLIKIATPVLILLPLASTLLSDSENSPARIVMGIHQTRLIEHTFEKFEDSGRMDLLIEAYQLGLAHPVVGAGLGGYKYVHILGITLRYPHNLVAEAWSELGMVGLILILLLGWHFARAYLPRLKSTWGLLSAAVITSGIFSMLSGDLYDARILFCFSLAWVLLYNTPHDETYPDTRPSPPA